MEKKTYGVEEFLSRPKRLEEEIRGDLDHIASLRSIVENRTTHLSFTAGRNPSKNEKAFENVMIQIAEEEKRLEEKQKRLVELKLEVENYISLLPKKNHRTFLRLKYVSGRDMTEIRDIMGLPKSTCHDLQESALSAARKIYYKKGNVQ